MGERCERTSERVNGSVVTSLFWAVLSHRAAAMAAVTKVGVALAARFCDRVRGRRWQIHTHACENAIANGNAIQNANANAKESQQRRMSFGVIRWENASADERRLPNRWSTIVLLVFSRLSFAPPHFLSAWFCHYEWGIKWGKWGQFLSTDFSLYISASVEWSLLSNRMFSTAEDFH